MTRMLRVASAQYPLQKLASFNAFVDKFSCWVAEAAGAGAELLLFPEYFSMEIAHTAHTADLAAQLDLMQVHYAAFHALLRQLAMTHRVCICAGTYPVRDTDGRVRNRSLFAFADGRIGAQDKLTMTRFENEQWLISPGRGLQVFDLGNGRTSNARIGIAICYDSEFPAIAGGLAERGVEVLLVPSCTDTLAGYQRVRIGCQARALENQFYVLQSVTVGGIVDSPSIDVNIGAAGVFAPPDRGFPESGILAIGELNQACWLHASLDLDRIAEVRQNGQVLNYADRGRAQMDGASMDRDQAVSAASLPISFIDQPGPEDTP